ncbi:unnamed protein product, partial [marine sediment metagenome]
APRTEEMTRVAIIGAGAGVTGAVQGVVVKVAPQLGALEPIFTWGTLLGIPAAGAALALFTRGMLSDLGLGIAAGGAGVVGYSLPELMAPITGRKTRGELTAEQRAALASGQGVKQLGAGLGDAARRAQSAARVGIEF